MLCVRVQKQRGRLKPKGCVCVRVFDRELLVRFFPPLRCVRGSWAGVSVRFAYDDYNVFEGNDMNDVEIKFRRCSIWFKNDLTQRRTSFS